VRDCALELLRQGHRPVVFSTRLGTLAQEMRALTIPVIDRLDKLTSKPDVVHGNSPIETVAALLELPDTPAIFVCHAWDNPDALPPKMPRIMRYLAVDDTCRDHLVCQEGIGEHQVLVRFNAVDLNRYPQRSALPERPARALVFSNNAADDNYLPVIRQACAALGIDLDVVGERSDRSVAQPEAILGRFDLVFAKGRCALEALATGTAVIVCDASGLGALVTSDNLDDLRRKNFGRRALQNTISSVSIANEIEKYDPEDAKRVTARVRASAGLSPAVRSLVAIYGEAIADFRSRVAVDWGRERQAAANFLQSIAPFTNTFYARDRLRAAEREIHALRQKLGSLKETLRMVSLTQQEQGQIRLLRMLGPSTVSPGTIFHISLELENASSRFVTSFPPFPVFLSYHWLSVDRSEMVCFEGLRGEIFPVLPPQGQHRYSTEVLAPDQPGHYCLRATLVQEQVTWFDAPVCNHFLETEMVVE
jgi:Glycosyltransferase Family 4